MKRALLFIFMTVCVVGMSACSSKEDVYKRQAYNTYRTAKAEYEQLATAKRNAEQILHGTPSRQKKHEQER